ncbi:hypothetical protein [Vibrio sp. AND4]|nr:hypothetical protein [Vibrio sp. AND4]
MGIVHALWSVIVSAILVSQLVCQHMETSLWVGMALIAAGMMVINFLHAH